MIVTNAKPAKLVLNRVDSIRRNGLIKKLSIVTAIVGNKRPPRTNLVDERHFILIVLSVSISFVFEDFRRFGNKYEFTKLLALKSYNFELLNIYN